MNYLSGKNFGLLIAYVLPGFVTLWALREVAPIVNGWLSTSPTFPAGVEAIVFVLLASVCAGMSVSAIRWALIDTLHRCTGLARPVWDDTLLPTHLQAFDAVVEWHYRHYQFYSNMAVALALLFISQYVHQPYPDARMSAGFFVMEALFVATSRDTLRKYYARASRLLGSLPRAERSANMANGSHPPKPSTPAKPTTETKRPSGSSK